MLIVIADALTGAEKVTVMLGDPEPAQKTPVTVPKPGKEGFIEPNASGNPAY